MVGTPNRMSSYTAMAIFVPRNTKSLFHLLEVILSASDLLPVPNSICSVDIDRPAQAQSIPPPGQNVTAIVVNVFFSL
jgi:hypothetical protein